jgi:protein-tyrosine phosphatase
VSLPILPGNFTGIDISKRDLAFFSNRIIDIYRSFSADEEIIAQYRKFFALMQDEANLPLSFHCSAGKDRTGIAAMLFLSSLGVSEEIIMQDYLLSNKYLENKYAKLLEAQPHFKPAYIVEAGYLQTTLDQIKADYGSVENYLKNTLNVDMERMKKIYLFNTDL